MTPRPFQAGELAFAGSALLIDRFAQLQDAGEIAMQHGIEPLAGRARQQHHLLDQLAQDLWGEASNGDVDIGTWWVQDGRYCRAWRRWFAGATQCWTLALQRKDQIIIWLGERQQRVGATTLEHGNSLGRSADSQLFATAADPQVEE